MYVQIIPTSKLLNYKFKKYINIYNYKTNSLIIIITIVNKFDTLLPQIPQETNKAEVQAVKINQLISKKYSQKTRS